MLEDSKGLFQMSPESNISSTLSGTYISPFLKAFRQISSCTEQLDKSSDQIYSESYEHNFSDEENKI